MKALGSREAENSDDLGDPSAFEQQALRRVEPLFVREVGEREQSAQRLARHTFWSEETTHESEPCDTGVSLEAARRCERAGREITATYARAVGGLRSNGNDPLLPLAKRAGPVFDSIFEYVENPR